LQHKLLSESAIQTLHPENIPWQFMEKSLQKPSNLSPKKRAGKRPNMSGKLEQLATQAKEKAKEVAKKIKTVTEEIKVTLEEGIESILPKDKEDDDEAIARRMQAELDKENLQIQEEHHRLMKEFTPIDLETLTLNPNDNKLKQDNKEKNQKC